MKDAEFAVELVKRLNKLCEDDEVRVFLSTVFDAQFKVSESLANKLGRKESACRRITVMGIVNALMSRAESGKGELGRVSALWTDAESSDPSCPGEELVGFTLTHNVPGVLLDQYLKDSDDRRRD